MATQDELKARRAAAQAKLAELEKKNEAARASVAELREVEDLERDAAARGAVLEHGGEVALGRSIVRVDAHYADGTLRGSVVLKAPALPAFRAFANKLGDVKGVELDQLQEKFWRPCLLWPTEDAVAEIFVELPGFREAIVNALLALSSSRKEAVAGKS